MSDVSEDVFPPHKCGLYLTHNEHRDYYETVEQWLTRDSAQWESASAKQRAIETDEVWTLQWYPETPVGFHSVAAPTLAECLAFAANGERT